jgi:hypothetical protein
MREPTSHDGGTPRTAAPNGPVGPAQGPGRPFLLPRRAWLDATKRAIRDSSTPGLAGGRTGSWASASRRTGMPRGLRGHELMASLTAQRGGMGYGPSDT